MENLNNLPPFYVGQKVVATKNHPLGAFKKDDKFTILQISKKCCSWNVTIGITMPNLTSECRKCGRIWFSDGQWWFLSEWFAPIKEQKFPLIKLTRIIEKELVSAN